MDFHVHINASIITLGFILLKPGERNIYHPIYISSQKLSQDEHNYTIIERKGLAIVYALQRFIHYLLGDDFKFFTDQYSLKDLVNKPLLEGRIYRWLFHFQEFSFKVVVKPGKLNVGPDNLSRLETRESGGPIDDKLPDVDFFHIYAIPKYL
jgi:hypothetical protein